MIEIRQTEIYVNWFESLRDRQAKVRIDIRIRRLSMGNLGDVKPVGQGVSELRIRQFKNQVHHLGALCPGGSEG